MAVKAGPKKRRAKSEAEAIREAVEEHGARGTQTGRRASKVRKYAYKETAKKQAPKRKLSLDKRAEGLNDRNVREWEPWEETILFMEPTKVVDALTRMQIECEHKSIKEAKPVALLGEDWQWRTCSRCQAVLRWYGSFTATIQAEWMSYRIEGYSMPEWGDLFNRDKSLWLFLIEEAAFVKGEQHGE